MINLNDFSYLCASVGKTIKFICCLCMKIKKIIQRIINFYDHHARAWRFLFTTSVLYTT